MSQNAILQKYAINNGADSDDQAENDMTPFINIFNEFYAKETSRKIRAIFKANGQAWKPLCMNPPYGHVKDPEDKTHWIVNEEVAELFSRIKNPLVAPALALLFLFDFFLRRFFLCSLLFHKIEIVWLESIV